MSNSALSSPCKDKKRCHHEDNSGKEDLLGYKSQKKRKEVENEDLKEHFAIQHSLSPYALRTFHTASNAAASHLKSLGSSSSDTFIRLLANLCRISPTEIFKPSLHPILASLSGYSAEIRMATLMLYNELITLQGTGSTLNEATTALASRFEANSYFSLSNSHSSQSAPLHPHAHIELEQLISPIQLSEANHTHKTHFSSPARVSLQAQVDISKSEQIDDSERSIEENPSQVDEKDENDENEEAYFDSSSVDSSHSSELENGHNSDLDEDEPTSQLSNSRKRRHQEVNAHRSDLLEKLQAIVSPKRKCLSEAPHEF